jgi:hypothetical protein
MQVVLRTILTHCRLAAAGTRPERQQRRAVTLRPKRGTRVILESPEGLSPPGDLASGLSSRSSD